MVAKGTSLSEYALLGALLALISLASLEFMGGSISGLLKQESLISSQGTLSVLAPVNGRSASGQPGSATGTGNNNYYGLQASSTSGEPVTDIAGDMAGGRGNATSVDGIQEHVLGTLVLAKRLALLAEQQTDPAQKSYYAALAEKAYYMGAAEGELEDVSYVRLPGTFKSSNYNNATALRDLYQYKAAFDALLSKPPAGLNQAEFQNEVSPLTAEIVKIGTKYLDNLSAFITPQGTVKSNFVIRDDSKNYIQRPGGSFEEAAHLTRTNGKPAAVSYDSLIPYNELKTKVDTLLDQNQISVQPVDTTWRDGRQVDTHATPSGGTSDTAPKKVSAN